LAGLTHVGLLARGREPGARRDRDAAPDDLWYRMYTAGSAGGTPAAYEHMINSGLEAACPTRRNGAPGCDTRLARGATLTA
jgi:hypothetical protein